jgi:hypothetical protein
MTTDRLSLPGGELRLASWVEGWRGDGKEAVPPVKIETPLGIFTTHRCRSRAWTVHFSLSSNSEQSAPACPTNASASRE